MLRSLYSGVSGLRNHQTRLDVIGNNIANVNTIGFKSSTVTFKDLFSQTLRAATGAQEGGRGGANPVQVGLGMTLASIDTNHSDGSIQYTGKDTDLAIEGNGFFVLRDGQDLLYTRAGNFDLDEQGYLVVPGTGMRVQGISATGGIGGDIRVYSGTTFASVGTTLVEFANNLDVEAQAVDGNPPQVRTTFEVFDSLGSLHGVELVFTRDLAENAWDWTAYSTVTNRVTFEGTIAEGLATGFEENFKVVNTYGVVETVRIIFTDDGTNPGEFEWQALVGDTVIGNGTTLNDTATVEINGEDIELDFTLLSQDPSESDLTIATSGAELGNDRVEFDRHGRIKRASAVGQITLSPTLADAPQKIDLDFSVVTGAAGASSISVPYRDGAPQGSLKSYSIDSSGTVVGEFSNGLIKDLGQLALATFANPGGLMKVGETAFVESNNSGQKQVGKAGTSGFGSIASSSLEMSNVDLSFEFTEMIVTQRGLQANSRIITTSDEVLQEIVNLKR